MSFKKISFEIKANQYNKEIYIKAYFTLLGGTIIIYKHKTHTVYVQDTLHTFFLYTIDSWKSHNYI